MFPITTAAQLRSLADEWTQLAPHVPFLSHEWLCTWWRIYGAPHAGRELLCLAVRDRNERLVGLAPFYRERHIGIPHLHFLGDGEACGDYATILHARGDEGSVVSAIADWLSSSGQDRWKQLELSGVDVGDGPVFRLARELSLRGQWVTVEPAGYACWRLPLPQTWNEFLLRLSSGHRHKVRKLERRVIGTGQARAYWAETAEDLHKGCEILIDLHQRRQRELGHRGAFSSPNFREFFSSVAEQYFAHGRLWLIWVEYEGKPCAANVSLLEGDRAYGFVIGVDPQAKRYSPGALLLIHVLRRAIDSGLCHYDFLRGDQAYKAHWRAQRHPTFVVTVATNRLSAQLNQAGRLGVQRAKQLLRAAGRSGRSRFDSLMLRYRGKG